MSTLLPAEVVTTMAENRKLYSEINQLRAEQQDRAQKIEVLQEESYKVTTELVATQGIVKNVAQETTEKLKTHLTEEMIAEIVQQEAQVKEKFATANDTL
jgi:hypothetical protein